MRVRCRTECHSVLQSLGAGSISIGRSRLRRVRRQPDRRLLVDVGIGPRHVRRPYARHEVYVEDLFDAGMEFQKTDRLPRGQIDDRHTALQATAIGRDRHAAEGCAFPHLGKRAIRTKRDHGRNQATRRPSRRTRSAHRRAPGARFPSRAARPGRHEFLVSVAWPARRPPPRRTARRSGARP
jgi:hypothetical protein